MSRGRVRGRRRFPTEQGSIPGPWDHDLSRRQLLKLLSHPGAHGTLSRIDHMLGHKTNLNKFRKIKVTPCIFSNHSAMKLEINQKKKSGKNTNMWRLSNMLLNNEWINQEIKEEIKKYMEKGAPGWLSQLSICLWLRSWSRCPGIKSCLRLPAHPGACFSLCLPLPLLVCSLPSFLSLSNK